jgi:molybdate transport system substrate-binding protein
MAGGQLYDGALRFLAAILTLALASSAGSALEGSASQKLTVAAAADLQFALTDLARDFRRAHSDVDLETVFGSSGNFYAEIGNQAPFDVFLSADIEYPRKLIQAKLAVAESLFVYGTGHLVLWVGKDSSLDLPHLQMHALEAPSVKHIAIANPQHAPYGRAAEAALRSAGLYDHVASKLVLGENIAQTFQFAQSGAADIGMVALALALAPSARQQGRYWEIPADAYPKIEQAGVILTHAANPEGAREFRAFMVSDAGRKALKSYGFY